MFSVPKVLRALSSFQRRRTLEPFLQKIVVFDFEWYMQKAMLLPSGPGLLDLWDLRVTSLRVGAIGGGDVTP